MPLRRCAVIGSPVAHSLSPVMHRAAHARLHLEWSYSAIEVTSQQLPAFLAGLDGSWRGLSLTMPLKRVVLPLLDEVSPTAAAVGAVNTVVLEDGERRGDNTDVPGMVAALTERRAARVQSALVLGTGATAASAVYALSLMAVPQVTIRGRDQTAAQRLAETARQWGVSAVAESLAAPAQPVDLLVSTLPGSAHAEASTALARAARCIFDVSYDPWPSRLLTRAAAAGRQTVSGLDLLAHQAALQVVAMSGHAVAVDVLRDAAAAALGSRP